MFSVAIIGPDGVGKTTVSRILEQSLHLPAKYLYMGVNADSSNVALPTTRLMQAVRGLLKRPTDTHGPLDHARANRRPPGRLRRIIKPITRGLRLINQLAEESYRQLVVRFYVRKGIIVLLDRDFFVDYYAYDIANRDETRLLSRRIHGFLLERFYRRPDLVIFLDADAKTMFARKGEGTIELLERRRQDYMELGDVLDHFIVVDATRSTEQVAGDVRQKIYDFHSTDAEYKKCQLTP